MRTHTYRFTTSTLLRDDTLEVVIEGEGYEDPGVCSGPPELCYPPESDRRMLHAYIVDADGHEHSLADANLSQDEWSQVECAIWSDVSYCDNDYDDYCNCPDNDRY